MRRHYTNYFRALPGIKPYRHKLVTLDEPDALLEVLEQIREKFAGLETARLNPQNTTETSSTC